MTGTWVKRSLRYYGARHAVFAGTVALTAAILGAALLTGESLRAGLRRGLDERLGPVRAAALLAEGVFPASLAGRLPDTQAALLLRGELLTAEGAVCADRVQVIGLAEATNAFLNARGRALLAAEEGAVRFEKPSALSVEMPLGAASDARLARRALRVGPAGARFGLIPPDFALRAGSVPPVNVFLPRDELAEAAGVPGLANLLVSSRARDELVGALAAALTPEDAGLMLEDGGRRPEGAEGPGAGGAPDRAGPSTVIRSRRVFLPPGLGAALAAQGLSAEWATFHLADAFEAGAREAPDGAATNAAVRATPYGFVAAVTPGAAGVPADLGDGEVVVNAWLAETLGLATNATLTLRWRRFEAGGRLVADSRAFRVRAILPTAAAALAKAAMPVFPGLEGVDSCAAWDVGMPMDEERLKDEANEAYWKQWRETPKAFLTFEAGRACFGTAFGEAMSARVAAEQGATRRALQGLTPAQLGFAVRPVREEGLQAAAGSTDFNGLFVGMACVLMASALLLTSLTLALALEARQGEVALFRAVGWGRGRIVGALAAEWSPPLLAGALAGAGCGAALARALVWSLGRFWSGAFAGAELAFAFSWPAAGLAAAASATLAYAVLLARVWRAAGCQPAALWRPAGGGPAEALRSGSRPAAPGASVAGAALAAGALALMVLSPAGAAANGAFFGAGFLLMLSLLLFVRTAAAVWRGPGRGAAGGAAVVASPVAAGVGRAAAAPRRSAPVVILLAVGVFLTVGILSMKHDPAAGCERPSSGSGGFAALVTSAVPLERGRGLELARRVTGAAGVVPVRVRAGDEAGCLNMNRPVLPQVLGLDARTLARARAFEPEDAGGVWSLLEQTLPDGAVPALAADQSMLQYSLHAKAGAADGTTYDYAPAGAPARRVRLVGALPVRSGILQGSIIVDEQAFVRLFPEASGYRLWLCDYAPYLLREAAAARRPAGPGRSAGRPSALGTLRHPEPGVTVETVEERLRLLGAVESTYLDLFLVLGGLGVVLGVFGVALVILRGVQERRGELALLSAVGLPRTVSVRLLAAEYGALVLAGLTAGILPALAAVQPAARALGGALPWRALLAIVAALAGCAGLSVFAAARAAVRRYGPEVLKEEV